MSNRGPGPGVWEEERERRLSPAPAPAPAPLPCPTHHQSAGLSEGWTGALGGLRLESGNRERRERRCGEGPWVEERGFP